MNNPYIISTIVDNMNQVFIYSNGEKIKAYGSDYLENFIEGTKVKTLNLVCYNLINFYDLRSI